MEKLLVRIMEATATPDGRRIPIHVSPMGLSITDQHLRSSALFQAKGRSLGEALREYLALLGLGYAVDHGFLEIDDHASATDRRIDAVERKLDALIKKLEAAPIFFDEAPKRLQR